MPEHNAADDRLVAAVRRAFSTYAAPTAIPPVVPSGQAARKPWVRISLAAVPLVAVALVVVLATWALTRPASAFASWTPIPGEPDPAVAASATESCWDSVLAPASLPLVALDQRGRIAVAIFSDGKSLADCMLVDGALSASSFGAMIAVDPLSGSIEVLNHGYYERESPVHLISGAVGDGVASVVVTRDDGVEVTATVANGVFVVWWPNAADAATFTALDLEGNVLESIDNPSRIPR